ncbi:MAG: MBL fold metallo-hydrolase [Parcubacteria group bacterium]|nr:MBL fold metallo-hydrolase [Parcubacteria group bacterium]
MQIFRNHRNTVILAVFLLLNLVIWYAVFAESRGGVLTVAFLDVGQGDAIFIEAPNGNQILVDGGPNKSVLRALGEMMPFYDRTIDAIVATHPDQDHISGLIDVLNRFSVAAIFEPGANADTNAYKTLEKTITAKKVPRILARRGMHIVLDEGVYLNILFPDRDMSNVETNTASIVAQLHYGDTDVLLTGDSPQAIEKYLVSLDGKALHADVLKPGHHGSKTSSSLEFIGAVSPAYAVISAGKNNKYGHPHQETLDTLKQFGVSVLRTDKSGTIVFQSDGSSIRIAD